MMVFWLLLFFVFCYWWFERFLWSGILSIGLLCLLIGLMRILVLDCLFILWVIGCEYWIFGRWFGCDLS